MKATTHAAEAVFLAGLPHDKLGRNIPGHTAWTDLGPEAQARYRRMAQAAVDAQEE